MERKRPINIGIKTRHALVESTFSTRELVVIVLTISILFILKALELLNALIRSLIILYCTLIIFDRYAGKMYASSVRPVLNMNVKISAIGNSLKII